MLCCEGYKMFEGAALVTMPNAPPIRLTGRWLYRPDTKYWYVNGCSLYQWGTSFPREEVTPEEES